ncbi:MAG: amidohydrolase family protein [Gammaproteobacteria bacterium]|jgi:imidazolonepropionase-like amidohydrolase|nr:amidohydrolase family protein [Gammaproteobacteria bacterium]
MNKSKLLMIFTLIVSMGSINISLAQSIAIVDGTIIDATGNAPIERGVILIEGSRISAVGPASEIHVPDDAQIIDAEGKYLIPGLIDANLHLYLNIDLETMIKYEDRYHEIIVEAAQITLKNGLTTVFDTWGPYEPLVQARALVNAGEAVGSRIFMAGNIIGFDGPLSADFRAAAAAHVSNAFVTRTNEAWEQGVGRELMWWGPEEVSARVSEYAESEIDFLKYGASGHVDMAFITFSQRVQNAMVEAAHAAGKNIQAHTTSIESVDMAVNAGVDILTHCDISGPFRAIPAETIQKIVEQGIACSILPVTQERLDGLLARNPTTGVGPDMIISRVNITNLAEAGANLLLSTDGGIQHPLLTSEQSDPVTVDPRTKLGEGHFNALVALEQMGLDSMEILQIATSNSAKAYNLDDDIGTLSVGKIADIVILNENPLQNAENYRAIYHVIKDGKIVDIDALPVAPIISSIEVPAREE